ncbi:MAG: hypothetical protein IKK82_08650 [Kiritimatiellae bacterium]|nr:hypothetical protein [Kiritimatiellia bacterium]
MNAKKTLSRAFALSCVAVLNCALAALSVGAEEYTLKSSLSGSDFDWSSGDSYVGDVAPSKGDYVTIPEDMDAKLSSSSPSWDFVTNTIARIRPITPTSRLVVDVPENEVAEFPCEVTIAAKRSSEYYGKGNLTKIGLGELKLSATADPESYFSIMIVSNGTLTLLENAASGDKYYFDELHVCSNALLNAVNNGGHTVCRMFFGEGTIHGSHNGRFQTIFSQTDKSVFHGMFTGFTNSFLYVASPVELWGTNSTATGVIKAYGAERNTIETGAALGMVSFAKEGDVCGTIGRRKLVQLGDSEDNQGGGIRYLGSGGTVNDFTFNVRGEGVGSFVFLDAGQNGGLLVTNCTCETGTKAAAMHREFILTGTGSHTNRFHCWLRERAKDDKWCPIHLVKRGTCTWRLHQHKKTETALTGGVSVENGTLQYDTIADAGQFCSLGFATNLYEAYTGALDPSRKVDWAIALGTAAGTQGTIEYTGKNDVYSTNRIIALKGDGRILHNKDTLFRFSGIKSSGDNAKTLTLDGEGSNRNQIMNLSDADGGAISITKSGSGLWELLPSVSFSGDLTVEGGCLNLVAPTYSWFRFVLRQSYTDAENAPNKKFKLREMAFFDADGVSQSIGLQFGDNWRNLPPGQFAYAKDGNNYSSENLNSLFDDSDSEGSATLGTAPVVEDESTWMPLIFRMPAGANGINSFDFAYDVSANGTTRGLQPGSFYVEGSVDGFEWTRLFETNNVVSPGSGYWLSKPKFYSAGSLTLAITDEAKRRQGFIFEQPENAARISLQGSVCVKHGATLNSCGGRQGISSFKIDMTTGGGTLNGFDFAQSGTISLVNVPEDMEYGMNASFNPVNCIGMDNLSDWTLLVNGEETVRHKVRVSADGNVRVTKIAAMRVIIR